MTTEEAQKVLDELQGVRPEMLNNETKRLFEAIMKIADTRDEALIENRKLKTMVDLMAEVIMEDENFMCEFDFQEWKNKEEVKQYFENKAKEYLKER